MAKYQPSKYYADDKDVYDILSSPKLSSKALIALCRRRGIFISEESPREELVHYMSKLPFNWTQIQEVMVEVQRDDREEKLTACKIASTASVDDVASAINQVQESRKEQMAEQYTVSQTKDGRVHLKVTYFEPDFQKARLIQRRERELTVEVEKKGSQFEVRHTQNERANAIISSILEKLTPPDSDKKPVRKTIELSGVRNHEHRTQFFVNLIGGMEGFQLREVRDLKVDHLGRETGDGLEDQEKAEEEQSDREQLRSLVRKIALSGENILISPQYQRLAKDGFFISKAVWTSVETTGAGRLFEFEAEFKDAENAANFAYQIRGVYNRDGDGEVQKTRSDLPDVEKSALKDCLEASAYAAVDQVNLLRPPAK